MPKKLIYNTEGKICSKCKVFKTWDMYSKDKTNKYGYTCNCKDCRNEMKKEYRQTQQGHIKDLTYKRQKRFYKEFRQEEYRKHNEYIKTRDMKEYHKAYYQKRKDIINKNREDKKSFLKRYWNIVMLWDMKWKILDCKNRLWVYADFWNMKRWIWSHRLKYKYKNKFIWL